MSSSMIDVTSDSLDSELRARGALLLDCWAPWCAPCRALSPLLQRLAPEYEGVLRIAKLDVDAHPSLAERLGARSIPLLVLFKDGQEQARRTGLMTLPQLREWLGRHDVRIGEGATPTARSDEPTTDASLGGAFYGDAELAQFLLQRLQRHAEAGEVLLSRVPCWNAGKGTVTAALVHSARTEVFERVSGLPASLANALHFAGISSAEEVAEVAAAMRAGRDFDAVAPALVEDWLADEANQWPRVLPDPAVDALRLRWLQLRMRTRAGETVAIQEWHALRQDALDQCGQRDPYRMVHSTFAEIVAALCPFPEPGDDGAWRAALLLKGNHLKIVAAQAVQGWDGKDIATEALRHAWFVERQAQEPDGRLSDERLKQLQAQWLAENTAWAHKEQAFRQAWPALIAPLHKRLRECLARLLEAAPTVQAGQ